jgi:hypothetical protein
LARIYLGLAIFAMLLLLTNLVLGLATGDYGEAATAMFEAGTKQKTLEQSSNPNASEVRAAENDRADALARAQELRGIVSTHMLLGIAASLVTILVNSVAVTYFVGTSRWCKEVVESYRLDPDLAEQSQRLKRRTFPWAVAGMLTIVALVALGALSDPSVLSDPDRNPARHLTWRTYHYLAAILGTGFLGVAFYVQQQNVAANYRIIEQIVAEVRRIRAERGLDDDGAGEGEEGVKG